MDLKGCTVTQALHDSRRLHVWYEEERDGGLHRVRYSGRVTHYNASLGLRVWFDGFSASEQEWVNEGDEWEWEDPIEPTPGAGASEPLPDELPPPADYEAVSIRLRAAGDVHQTFRMPPAPSLPTCGVRSSLALAGTESSPRKFNKKARLLKAGMEDSLEEERRRKEQAGAQLQEEHKQEEEQAQERERRRQAAAAADASVTEAPAAAGTVSCLIPSQGGKRARDARSAGISGGASAAAASGGRAGKAGKAAAAPTTTPSLKLRVTGSGVSLLLPAEGAQLSLFAQLTQCTAPTPPPDAASKYGICSFSGLPARYRDPLTGSRYGSLEAFKGLRAEHARVAGNEGP